MIAYYQRLKGKEPVFGSVNCKLIVLVCGAFPSFVTLILHCLCLKFQEK